MSEDRAVRMQVERVVLLAANAHSSILKLTQTFIFLEMKHANASRLIGTEKEEYMRKNVVASFQEHNRKRKHGGRECMNIFRKPA